MEIKIFERLEQKIQKSKEKNIEKVANINAIGINKDKLELAEKLDAIQEYTIDRIEGNIVVIEEKETGKIENISKKEIQGEIQEGDIIKCINGKYFVDKEETKKIEKEIEDKYKNLWE